MYIYIPLVRYIHLPPDARNHSDTAVSRPGSFPEPVPPARFAPNTGGMIDLANVARLATPYFKLLRLTFGFLGFEQR